MSTNKNTCPDKLLFNLAESADMIGMSTSWMKTQTQIPYVRIGRRKLFRLDDLKAFIDKNVRGITR